MLGGGAMPAFVSTETAELMLWNYFRVIRANVHPMPSITSDFGRHLFFHIAQIPPIHIIIFIIGIYLLKLFC